MASFLESLFGAFTGQPAIDAANAARETLLTTFLNEAVRGRELVHGAPDVGWPGYSAEATAAAAAGRDAYLANTGAARGDLWGGTNNAVNALQMVAGEPLADSRNMYSNALGLNGPGGNAAAEAAFQTSPGYEFQVGQGLESIARQANAAGMLASGNMLRESQQFAQGLANQEYNNWLRNLHGREQLYAPIAARAGEYYNDLGRNLGTLDVNTGQFLAGSFIDEAARRANLGMGQYGTETGLAGIFGPALATTNLAVGAAQQQAGANIVNTGLNIFSGLGRVFSGGLSG